MFLALDQAKLFFLPPSFNAGTVQVGELWQTDGTAAGTVPVLVGSAPVGGGQGSVSGLVALGGVLYFTVTNQVGLGASSVALWRSDGTSSGTY